MQLPQRREGRPERMRTGSGLGLLGQAALVRVRGGRVITGHGKRWDSGLVDPLYHVTPHEEQPRTYGPSGQLTPLSCVRRHLGRVRRHEGIDSPLRIVRLVVDNLPPIRGPIDDIDHPLDDDGYAVLAVDT